MNKRIVIRFLSIFMILGILCLFNGCVVVDFISNSEDTIYGTGEIVSKKYPVSEFKTVVIDTFAEVIYSSAPSNSVTVEIQENLLPYLHITTKDNQLLIKQDKQIVMSGNKIPKIHISTPNLEGLIVRGGLTLKQADTLTAQTFLLDISGGCDVELPIEVEQLNIQISGAGDLRLSGEAKTANINISGTGDLEALDLKTEDTTINISGVGDARICCSQTLNVSISGAGSLAYKGNPRINQHISGAGTIENIK